MVVLVVLVVRVALVVRVVVLVLVVCFTSCPNWIYQFRRWRANLLASDVWLPLPVAAVFSRK